MCRIIPISIRTVAIIEEMQANGFQKFFMGFSLGDASNIQYKKLFMQLNTLYLLNLMQKRLSF